MSMDKMPYPGDKVYIKNTEKRMNIEDYVDSLIKRFQE